MRLTVYENKQRESATRFELVSAERTKLTAYIIKEQRLDK